MQSPWEWVGMTRTSRADWLREIQSPSRRICWSVQGVLTTAASPWSTITKPFAGTRP